MGIDLGTTNSLIAYINDGQPTVMPDHDGKSVLVPSVIYFDENDLASIGEIAKDKLISDPSEQFFCQRLMVNLLMMLKILKIFSVTRSSTRMLKAL